MLPLSTSLFPDRTAVLDQNTEDLEIAAAAAAETTGVIVDDQTDLGAEVDRIATETVRGTEIEAET